VNTLADELSESNSPLGESYLVRKMLFLPHKSAPMMVIARL
jgi:hypothetical protein